MPIEFKTKAVGSKKWIRVTDLVVGKQHKGKETQQDATSDWKVEAHQNDDSRGGLVLIESAPENKDDKYSGGFTESVSKDDVVPV